MALTTFILDSRIDRRLVKQTAAGTTADADVVGKAPTIYGMNITNTANSNQAAYVKLYDATTATNASVPTMNIKVAQNQVLDMQFPDGLVFSTGLCLRAAQQADDANASTAPAANLLVTILTS